MFAPLARWSACALFGSFTPEGERVRYGLTGNIGTHKPLQVAFHEYQAMWHDLVRARGAGDKMRVLFKGPGWRPDVADMSEVTEG